MTPEVTICLLNWKRPANLPVILESFAAQTVPCQVYLWNNGAPLPESVTRHPLVKMVVDSDCNLCCLPRWWLASIADTDYVTSWDDDTAMADPLLLADSLAAHKKECPNGIIGTDGWIYVKGQTYYRGKHIRGSAGGMNVDVIKGGYMFMPRRLLKDVPLYLPCFPQLAPGPWAAPFRAEDIMVSLCVSKGQPGFHRVPAILAKRKKMLPSNDALSTQKEHLGIRDAAYKLLMLHFGKGIR